MEKDSKTTVAVERTTFAKLDRLAKANSVSKMEYITHAINYFEKYGINPVEHESPAQEMQKLIKRMDQVFAFLKKQETDLVRPACEALAGASTQITISLYCRITVIRTTIHRIFQFQMLQRKFAISLINTGCHWSLLHLKKI